MKISYCSNSKRYINQQGIVLMAALMILLTLTLIALALVRLGVVELKVAGASQRYQILLNDAESMISHYFFSNQNSLVNGCLGSGIATISNNSIHALPTSAQSDECRFIDTYTTAGYFSFEGDGALSILIPDIQTHFSRVNLRIEKMGCIDNYFSQVGSGQAHDTTAPSALFFDIRATAWDIIDSDASVTVHSGVITQLPPGSPCRSQ